MSRGRRRRLGFFPFVLPVLVALAAVSLTGVATRSPVVAQEAAPEEPDGEHIYLRDCAICHGPEGRGTPLGQSLEEVGPAEVHYSITTGRMPIAKTGDERRRRPVRYSPEEIDALVEHMRSFVAPEPDIPEVNLEEGKLAEGAELFSAECASCHQWAGQGGALMGREAPALDRATPVQVVEAIHTGPVAMPEFGEEVLSEEDVNSIAKYVEYLRNPEDRGGEELWHLGPLAEGLIALTLGLGLLILAVLWIGERE